MLTFRANECRTVLLGSNRDACHAELLERNGFHAQRVGNAGGKLSKLACSVAGERAGEEVANFGRLGLEQHGQRAFSS